MVLILHLSYALSNLGCDIMSSCLYYTGEWDDTTLYSGFWACMITHPYNVTHLELLVNIKGRVNPKMNLLLSFTALHTMNMYFTLWAPDIDKHTHTWIDDTRRLMIQVSVLFDRFVCYCSQLISNYTSVFFFHHHRTYIISCQHWDICICVCLCGASLSWLDWCDC